MKFSALFAVFVAAGLVLVPTGADAHSLSNAVARPQLVPVATCDGQGKSYVVKTYHRGSAAYPLRCGSPTWGFVHLVNSKRWCTSLDTGITLTFAYGENATDIQGDGGSNIWELFDNNCNLLFTVIYNSDAYNGNSFKPQGVITAYPANTSAVQRGVEPKVATGTAAPAYASDCPIIQNV